MNDILERLEKVEAQLEAIKLVLRQQDAIVATGKDFPTTPSFCTREMKELQEVALKCGSYAHTEIAAAFGKPWAKVSPAVNKLTRDGHLPELYSNKWTTKDIALLNKAVEATNSFEQAVEYFQERNEGHPRSNSAVHARIQKK